VNGTTLTASTPPTSGRRERGSQVSLIVVFLYRISRRNGELFVTGKAYSVNSVDYEGKWTIGHSFQRMVGRACAIVQRLPSGSSAT
jgi:hypothetical protein